MATGVMVKDEGGEMSRDEERNETYGREKNEARKV